MILPFSARRAALARYLLAALLPLAAAALPAAKAHAHAMLLIEADSGRVLHQENATQKWYPASVTKLMTAYVTLKAVKAGRLSLDTLLTVSPNAAAQAPTKMGFKIGSQITVDNALKSIMVKSANDMSVALAEGLSGSISAFADEMNAAAASLGMTQTSYVNPNGLPADEQITSARDMAILARAIYRELPEYEMYWRIPAIKYGKRLMRNTNTLLDRFPGTDGMKTGFICASGFNMVVSAKRNGRRLIAVMLGAPSGAVRAVKVAQMLERGFQTGTFNWLTSAGTTVEQLAANDNPPPNLREEICGKKRKRPAAESEDDVDEIEAALPPGMDPNSPQAIALSALRTANHKPSALIGPWTPSMEPIEVFLGAYKGAVPVQTADAPKKKAKKKKKEIAAKSEGQSESKSDAKSAAAKPQSQQVLAPAQGDAAPSAKNTAKKSAKKKSTPSGAPANAEASAKPPAKPAR